MEIRNKNVLVVGLARSGVSAANLLCKLGAKVTITDEKRESELSENIRKLTKGIYLKLGGHNGVDIANVDLVVISPGVPWDSPFLNRIRENGIRIISEVELAFKYIKAPLIAVTGTNGKTTTTTLIGEMLKKDDRNVFVGGNIGNPMCEEVLNGSSSELILSEISTFQMEGIETFKPHISVILNITPDHMDRHKSMTEYIALKKRVFINQNTRDYTVFNMDDKITAALSNEGKGERIFFSRIREVDNGAFVRGNNIIFRRNRKEEIVSTLKDLKIIGVHNIENTLASVAVGGICDIPPRLMREVISEFSGIPHRMEFVREIEGIKFINDSKGTNVGATIKSIESFNEPIILIAGGKDKGSDYLPLKPLIEDRVKFLILIGEAKKKMASVMNGFRNILNAESFEEAVNEAFDKAEKGDVVLLSPACASFDMFRDYEDRGEQFRKIVESL
ncbi:MAG: UDP-N-acetylmuramoylalanine--D-glutamate ligase [Nitrospinae bacterium RIFCSPLOWO2_02_FULL_39_110]|nr:MAG: UDP-N-acetylmuramoylalanine--D-glutamate ligase [Nitrospinae bacterium RIFCSPHIGHO2_02_39_11]OGV99302.1 MAG: UDP-N-acetylmuramoylalanine--D-glutamate ligase [Nitrospinae bacterium RIFCSPHIGHO2_12_FULL_39_42]OGW01541.1 MAG: UDP-N-acetylmuramoylalanine--D-glutamate ligase [Nitrospinae bacterium RIFCSPHIGHO2_02_FULL_39_82]OGW05639.1 MAG: UDP-N-acetylmuramoylalanine--D-glutamate ligase [Nitrospinae bacterium RIFCSPLOWO2_02_FULL_39_110]OGW06999.1 MAG: UDP-N-acetylmuramoylalanine--D-glutamate